MTTTRPYLTEAQLAERRDGISSTDVAAIAGQHPYRSALDVYADKMGALPPADLSENEAVQWGIRLEPIVLERYSQEHGDTIVTPNVIVCPECAGACLEPQSARVKLVDCSFCENQGYIQEIYHHPDLDWARCTPDAFCQNGDSYGLEAKTVGVRSAHRWGDEGTDSVPREYLIQCAWGMFVCDRPYWDLAALIGGQKYREYRIERLEVLEKALVRVTTAFIEDHLEKEVPPEPGPSKAATAILAKLYPESDGVMLESTLDMEELALTFKEYDQVAKEAEAKAEAAKNALKAIIGAADGIEGPWGKVTWKQSKDTTKTDWKGIAGKLDVPPELLKAHTKTKPGSRMFLSRFAQPK